MYADDTATLSSGASIEQAERRAQQAADVISGWAARWKMRIAGEKTQALALSQWARDATHLRVKVAGAEVTAGTSQRLLGVAFDRLLHFGAHCSELRKKVRPRIAHLRRKTGRSWGLNERQLRVVANGYIRGALEYAAGAWLPAASSSHIELFDREPRAGWYWLHHVDPGTRLDGEGRPAHRPYAPGYPGDPYAGHGGLPGGGGAAPSPGRRDTHPPPEDHDPMEGYTRREALASWTATSTSTSKSDSGSLPHRGVPRGRDLQPGGRA